VRCPACNTENLAGADQCANCGLDLAGLDVGAWGVDPRDPVLVKPLCELPLKDPLTLSGSASVSEAMRMMQDLHQGCVFVRDTDGALQGILTEHDVAARVAVAQRDPQTTRVEEVMTREPVALQRTDPLAWALHRMGVDGHRHLPVLDGKRLVGFLSARTVLSVLCKA
jgi:CBS domain-containing protein